MTCRNGAEGCTPEHPCPQCTGENDQWKEKAMKVCPCGSGLPRELQYDGRGIPLCFTCQKCHREKMSRYNPRILEYYTQADVDEQIEEDY